MKKSFKLLIVCLLYSIVACRTDNQRSINGNSWHISENAEVMKTEVLNHVPIGTTAAKARSAMEAGGFTCSWVEWKASTFIHCDMKFSKNLMVANRIQIILKIEEDVVSDVDVTTGLVGL